MDLGVLLRVILSWLVGCSFVLTTGCFRMPETPAQKTVTPFPLDNETFIDLVQTSLSALPGVHMSPARQALKKQEDQMFMSHKISDICRFEMNEDSSGLRQEVFGGGPCPLKIELENFDHQVDLEKSMVSFRENVMYVRERTSMRERQGVEVQAEFKFILDFSDGQATPRKLQIKAIAKHLRAGVLNLEGEMIFQAGGNDEQVLTMAVSNGSHKSVLEFKLGTNELRIDGGRSTLLSDPRAKLFTEVPDLTRAD